MTTLEILEIVPEHPAISAVVWLLIATVLLYIARVPVHRVLLALSTIIRSTLRMAGRSVTLASERLIDRNREVLLAAGREVAERVVEREFERIDATVQHDLAHYPSLQRDLHEALTRLNNDYEAGKEVPPAPPGWIKAVESVVKLPSAGDPMVANVLNEICESVKKAQNRAIEEYRKDSHQRHVLLRRMLPQWRRVQHTLSQVDKTVGSLLDRAKSIDRHMDDYRAIVARSDRAVRMLSSSAVTQFFISSLVLVIAMGGALINFQLIAYPLSDMVGGNSYLHFGLTAFKTADVAALVIILLEVALGLFLMESLRITRLFPIIGALDDRIRTRMAWAFFVVLLVLACAEAGLAYARDLLALDDAAVVGLLVEDEAAAQAGDGRWIATAAQMAMGFILPFALTFVAIPLESFVHSARTVVGILAVAVLRGLAFALRVLGNIAYFGGRMLIHLYDLMIFIPLWIERSAMSRRRPASATSTRADANAATGGG